MPYDQDVKELAYTLDAPCWVSYSGKPRWFKGAMDERRTASLTQAEATVRRLKQSAPDVQCNVTNVDEIMTEIGVRFRTFGGGLDSSWNNPIKAAVKDTPLAFAAGVDVKAVVELVLEMAKR